MKSRKDRHANQRCDLSATPTVAGRHSMSAVAQEAMMQSEFAQQEIRSQSRVKITYP